MTEAVLSLKNISVVVNKTQNNQTEILKGLDLDIYKGDFITVIGANGAGKSTFFNVIAGTQAVDSGQIIHNGKNINQLSAEKRTSFLSRVFQDPKMGTSPRMTVAENLLLAEKRGQKRRLRSRNLKSRLSFFKQQTQLMGNGLDQRLQTPTENLSGGQRQTLSFLMATIKRPDLLLLDEHTAALDPKTSADLMEQTAKRVTDDQLTCLMITHRMDDALRYGNRLIVIDDGRIIKDFDQAKKEKLTRSNLDTFFA
ncbi:ABC transporter ATP-binding protein [Oenococcus alcoholitolerans]|uniref:ABC transporter ATP-binding protein n=1 Tax=Oenococcus alcoholitolerans TaxID=931074 RepID=UPI003F71C994